VIIRGRKALPDVRLEDAEQLLVVRGRKQRSKESLLEAKPE
jgi:hypothetical protein